MDKELNGSFIIYIKFRNYNFIKLKFKLKVC